jgi:hypothetical protein
VHVGVAHAGAVHPHHDLVTCRRRVGQSSSDNGIPTARGTATRTTRPSDDGR